MSIKSNFILTPNIDRVIVKPVKISSLKQQETELLIPGQLKAGENLLCGEIVHPGDTKFEVGQIIYYSEYSASALVPIGQIYRGETQDLSEITKDPLIIIAKDDIMAYDKES